MQDTLCTLPGVESAATLVPRTGEEVHRYLLGRLNDALRRPGQFGGEVALVLLGDVVAHCRSQEKLWQEELDALRMLGAAYATGVSGVFSAILPGVGRHDDAVASVYAEIAHRNGWLHVDPPLSRCEYDDIRSGIPATCARDRTFTEILADLGPPSVHCGGVNRRYPKTLVYLTSRAEDPAICFHFWNAGEADPGRVPTEPTLLAARTGHGRFVDTFTFTPAGRTHCTR